MRSVWLCADCDPYVTVRVHTYKLQTCSGAPWPGGPEAIAPNAPYKSGTACICMHDAQAVYRHAE